jgi:purine-binding chemotaxis protein CheW
MSAPNESTGCTMDKRRLADVFHERAQQLAQRGRQSSSHRETLPILVLRTADERFGIELSYVRQVFPRVELTPVPGAPEALAGIANLNGMPRSVFDLGRLLRLRAANSRYVVLLAVEGATLGLAVEALEEVRRFDAERLVPLDEASDESNSKLTKGVTSDHVAVLDAAALVRYATTLARSASEGARGAAGGSG